MEAHEHKCGVHKMVTPLGITRGSSLNKSWGKCSIWLVDQWVPTSLCAFVCLTIYHTLKALDIIILDVCLVIVFIWGIDMLIILIDYFDYPHILTLLVVWLLCTFFLLLISFILIWLILLVVYDHDCYGACYHCHIFISISLCVDLDDIYLFCMVVWCMTAFLLCDCMLLVCVSHTSIFLPQVL